MSNEFALDEADVPVTLAMADEAPRIITFDGRSLEIVFRIEPVIDLNRMACAGYRIQPHLIDAARDQPLDAEGREALLASDMERIDRATLERGIAWMEAGAAPGTALILAISFLSASSQRARTNLMMRAGRLQHYPGTSVIWLLTDLPDRAPVSRLNDVVALLRPFGRAVFVETRLGGVAVKAARMAKVAGLVLAPGRADISATDAALWLLQAGKLAHRAAPALIAADLASPDLLPMAAAAGFTHGVVRGQSLSSPE